VAFLKKFRTTYHEKDPRGHISLSPEKSIPSNQKARISKSQIEKMDGAKKTETNF